VIGAEKVIEGPIRGPSLPLDNPILLRPRYSQFSRSARRESSRPRELQNRVGCYVSGGEGFDR
jgi:hypothetical protein